MSSVTQPNVIQTLANLDFGQLEEAVAVLPVDQQAVVKAAVIKYKARRSPIEFAQIASGGDWKPARHFQLLNDIFVDACHRQRFVIINLPVRHGKSELMSKYALAWYLGRFPNRKVILASYSLASSERLSTDVRNIFRATAGEFFDGLKLSQDTASKKRFNIQNHSGGLFATGVGSSIIGFGGNLIVMDDLYKDFASASSQRYEEDLRNWWTGTVRTRLEPGTSVILVLARWNDDISGWLLEQAKTIPNYDPWIQIKLPAICEDPDNDPLERKYGEALWPERWPVQELLKTKATSPIIWKCQYQQEPVDFGSSMFPLKYWNYIPPSQMQNVSLKHIVRAWDLSAGGPGSDYLAGVLMGIDMNGSIYILDVKNKKFTQENAQLDIKTFLTTTAQTDAEVFGKDNVLIRFEQAAGAGKSVAQDHLRTTFAGFDAQPVPKQGSDRTKVVAALPLSAQQQGGNCYILQKASPTGEPELLPWSLEYVQQMALFPNAQNDDMVDASSLAYSILSDMFHKSKPKTYKATLTRPTFNVSGSDSTNIRTPSNGRRQYRRGRVLSSQKPRITQDDKKPMQSSN